MFDYIYSGPPMVHIPTPHEAGLTSLDKDTNVVYVSLPSTETDHAKWGVLGRISPPPSTGIERGGRFLCKGAYALGKSSQQLERLGEVQMSEDEREYNRKKMVAAAPTPKPRLGLCDSPDTMGPHEKCDECINWKPLEAGNPPKV